MQVSLNALKSILQNNVAEVKFARKRLKPNEPPTRRMLCTNSHGLLNSANGRTILNYTPPRMPPKYNPDTKNLIITWDIFMQDYRTINVAKCQLVSVVPANDEFWTYFTETLSTMSSQDKTGFMKI